MQALEALAMSYDAKEKDIESACIERDNLKLELETLKLSMTKTVYELDNFRNSEQIQRQASSGTMATILQELVSASAVILKLLIINMSR